MQVKLGSWVAGRSDAPKGTVEWSGGYANFDNGPSLAYYKRVVVEDYMGGNKAAKSYIYSDRSGTWQSITVDTEGEGLQDKGVDNGDEDNKSSTASRPSSSTATKNSTSTAEPTTSSTGSSDATTTDGADSDADADAQETGAPDSGASVMKSLTVAGAVLSGLAVFANLL